MYLFDWLIFPTKGKEIMLHVLDILLLLLFFLFKLETEGFIVKLFLPKIKEGNMKLHHMPQICI
jgi:hypothetical protein